MATQTGATGGIIDSVKNAPSNDANLELEQRQQYIPISRAKVKDALFKMNIIYLILPSIIKDSEYYLPNSVFGN